MLQLIKHGCFQTHRTDNLTFLKQQLPISASIWALLVVVCVCAHVCISRSHLAGSCRTKICEESFRRFQEDIWEIKVCFWMQRLPCGSSPLTGSRKWSGVLTVNWVGGVDNRSPRCSSLFTGCADWWPFHTRTDIAKAPRCRGQARVLAYKELAWRTKGFNESKSGELMTRRKNVEYPLHNCLTSIAIKHFHHWSVEGFIRDSSTLVQWWDTQSNHCPNKMNCTTLPSTKRLESLWLCPQLMNAITTCQVPLYSTLVSRQCIHFVMPKQSFCCPVGGKIENCWHIYYKAATV